MVKLMKSDAALHTLTVGLLTTKSLCDSDCSFLNQHLPHAGRGVTVGSRGENIAMSPLLSLSPSLSPNPCSK